MRWLKVISSSTLLFKQNLVKNDLELTEEEWLGFFKFFGYGITREEDFNKVLATVFNAERVDNEVKRQKPGLNKNSLAITTDKSKNTEEQKVSLKESTLSLLSALKKFNRKNLFSLLKHFKYYDNGAKLISKYDFIKIFKDFRVGISIKEIENIFDTYCNDRKKVQMNYEEFIYSILEELPNGEEKLLRSIYAELSAKSKNNVSIDTLKFYYEPRMLFLNKDDNSNLQDFVESFELLHFDYLKKKQPVITEDEWLFYYKLVFFLNDNVDRFVKIIHAEWKKILKIDAAPIEIEKQVKTHQNNKSVHDSLHSNFENYKQVQENQKVVFENEKSVDGNQRSVNESNNSHKDNKSSRYNVSVRSGQRFYNARKENVKQNEDSVDKIRQVLENRGFRGLMQLHKQLLIGSGETKELQAHEFHKALNLQRIKLSKEELKQLTEMCGADGFVEVEEFIKLFKKPLKGQRLEFVERVFNYLKSESDGISLDQVKLTFDHENHPDVTGNRRSAEEILLDFFETFELNYNLLVFA